MKKILTLILIILSGLIFPIFLYISFIDTEIGILYNFILLPYIIFWIIPLLLFKDTKNLFIKLLVFNIILLLLIVYLFGLYAGNISSPKVMEAYDGRLERLSSSMIKELSVNDNYNINSIEDYLTLHPNVSPDHVDFYNCYYLSGIENGSGFILAYNYKSEFYKEKNGKNFYLYKSISDYVISDELMSIIMERINKECLE